MCHQLFQNTQANRRIKYAHRSQMILTNLMHFHSGYPAYRRVETDANHQVTNNRNPYHMEPHEVGKNQRRCLGTHSFEHNRDGFFHYKVSMEPTTIVELDVTLDYHPWKLC